MFVDPGDHELSATVPDVGTGRGTVHAEPGKAYSVVLTVLAPQPLPEVAPPAAPPAPPPPPPSGPSSLVVGGLIVGGVGLVAGAALAVGAMVVAGNANATSASLSSNGYPVCRVPTNRQASCNTLLDQLSQRDTLSNASVGAFVGGTAVAAGTLIYFFSTRNAHPTGEASGLWIAPFFAPSIGRARAGAGAGVVVGDSF